MLPVLFRIEPNIYVQSNHVMILLGALAALSLVGLESRRCGVRLEEIYTLTALLCVATLVGARLFFLAVYPFQYKGRPWELFVFWRGGTSVHGGALLAFLVYWAYAAWRRLDFWNTLDLFAPAAFFFIFLARIGCILAGCCYGRPCEPDFFLCYAPKIPPPTEHAGVPLYPTQAAYAIAGLGIFALLWARRKAKKYEGELVLLGTLLYTASAVAIGFFRGDEPRWSFQGLLLSPTQLANGLGFVAAAVVWLRKRPGRTDRSRAGGH